MYVFSALALSVAIIAILFGVYVLIQDRRSGPHRVFFLLCLGVGGWNLLATFTLSASTEQEFWFWFRPGSSFLILYVALLLHFALLVTESRHVVWLSVAGYVASLPIHYANLTGFYTFKAAAHVNGHWVVTPNTGSPWFYLWLLYSHGIMLAAGLIILRWGRRSPTQRIRLQARIVGWSFVGFLLVGSFCDFAVSRLLGLPPMSPTIFAACMVAISYAMVHCRFLAITHESVSRDLLQSMDTIVMLLDHKHRVITANRKAEEVFGCAPERLEGRQIDGLLSPARIVEEGLRRIDGRHRESFAFVAHVGGRADPASLDATISVVRDRFGDPLGTMMVAREQRGAGDFLRRFHITHREWETIQLVLAELPNRDIAEHLGVAERTVKAHVAHIYEKLGVDNKIGLVKVLQRYDLLPDASRIVGALQPLARQEPRPRS